MKDRTLKSNLYHSLGQEVQPKRLEETIICCKKIMQKQMICKEEPRTSFFRYLSDVFRYEGIPIFILQAVTLFLVCITIAGVADIPENIPVYMPFFVLAAVPVLFKSQIYGMSEIEAVTRASGAQIMLAKLVLAGAANLICITVVLCLEVSMPNNNSNIGLGQMVLFGLVPYLFCMTGMLRLVRLQRKENVWKGVVIMLGSSVGFALSTRIIPWLYVTSAVGFWLIAFVVFGIFFAKEVLFIVEMRKEGKMYGIIA